MKKLIFGLVTMLLMASCSDRKSQDNDKDQEAYHRILDSIAANEDVKRTEAEQARLDSLRLDSIRQDSIQKETLRNDSIAQEEKMRLRVSYFRDAYYDEKALKRIGFKKTKYKYTENEYEPGLSDEEVEFSRSFNGRRIDVKYVGADCHGVDIIFYDSRDMDKFMAEMKKIGYEEAPGGYFLEKYYITFNVKGNKIMMEGCG